MWYMPVNTDFVPFLVSYASDYAVETTYMALTLTNLTFADKNILVVLCVLPPGYAK
jgi:hypothetical protein